MSEASDRLDAASDAERRRLYGDYVDPDDYIRRGLAESAGGRRYIADQESDDRRYASNKSYKATKYSADKGYKGTKYSADRGLEGTKYSADKSYAGTVYSTDAGERNNKRDAGNTFLANYATLSGQPKNYFQAQEFLHNGIGAGYGSFVDDALAVGRPAGGFHPYVGAFPGNAAQALFSQGGEDEPDDVANSWREGDPIPPGYRRKTFLFKDQNGQTSLDSMIVKKQWNDDRKPGMRYYEHPRNPGQWLHDPAYNDPMKYPVTVYDQGGDDRTPSMTSPEGIDDLPRVYAPHGWVDESRPPAPLHHRPGYSGRIEYTDAVSMPQESADYTDYHRDPRSSLPRYNAPIDESYQVEPTTGQYFTEIIEPTTGQRFQVEIEPPGARYGSAHDEGIPAPRGRFGPPSRYVDYEQGGGMPYDQAGTNWDTMDSWATGEDKATLDKMDAAFRPGVQKWKAGYWEGLGDDEKDLWRSYWGYRGLSPRTVEHDVLSSRTGNADYFGQGRVA